MEDETIIKMKDLENKLCVKICDHNKIWSETDIRL